MNRARIRKKRKWPRIAAMIVLAAVLLGSVALVLVEKFSPEQSYIPQDIVKIPSRVVAAVVKPLQSAFAWVGDGVTQYLADVKLRKNIEIAYNELKAQNDQLTYESLRNAELEDEIERLKELLDVHKDYSTRQLNPIMAQVIGKETGNWFQMFTIDVGEIDGVKPNMAVVNASGLVGYTYAVYETTSEVISIVDSRAGVAGLIQSTRDQGSVRGTLGIDDEATCRMYYLPVDLVTRPGDVVVTSGIGAPFPKGIPIGTVRESSKYMDQNKHYVVIEPFADFMHIEEVLVLVYEAGVEEMPEQANDGQIRYSPVPMDTYRPIPSLGNQVVDPNLGGVTPPPRVTREPGSGDGAAGPTFSLAPGATPTPNAELDQLMQQEMDEMLQDGLEDAGGEGVG